MLSIEVRKVSRKALYLLNLFLFPLEKHSTQGKRKVASQADFFFHRHEAVGTLNTLIDFTASSKERKKKNGNTVLRLTSLPH
jgi:hypothetical protein